MEETGNNQKCLCKFCGEKKKLIDAHIVPKAFYTHFVPNRTNILKIQSDIPYELRCPAGFYDKNILCAECDRKLGVYDQEAQKLFLSDISKYKRQEGNFSAYGIPAGIFDYKKLKLFFISMLWRASISSNDSFKFVKLGDKFEAMALKVLRHPELDVINQFSVFIFKYKSVPNIRIERIFIEPIPCRADGINYYEFVFAGYQINIKVDSREFETIFNRICLKPSEELVIVEMLPTEQVSFISQISATHRRLKKL